MRIRSTKPEFWRSERVASVSWDARLVLKGVESYVDDNGVGKDDLALIVADIFPRDLSGNPTGTLGRVQEALDQLTEAGLLWRYEADGTSLLYVAFWETIQRIEKPTKGRLPRPDGTMNYRDSEIRESSRNTPGTLRPGTGEQGNRGTEDQGNSATSPSPRPEPADAELRPDVEQVCDTLADLIAENSSNGQRPTITKGWRDAARLLIDKDGRTVEQIEWISHWVQADDFWAPNVRSMPKLREKFEQLVQVAKRNAQRGDGRQRVSIQSQADALRFYEESA